MRSISTKRRQFDTRAVAVGGVVTAVGITAGYFLLGSLLWTGIGPVLGGLVTGWISRTFEGEAIDGAVAATLGPFLAPFFAAVVVYLRTPGLSEAYRIDAGLWVVLLGLGLALVAGLVTMPIGLATGYVAATVRRRAAFIPDTQEV